MKTGLDDGGPDGASTDGASLDTGAAANVDAGTGDSGGDDSSPEPAQTWFRIAQLSPDLPPIDFCVALHGTATFRGPLLAALAASPGAGDAATTGLSYAQVSAYFAVTPGQYDLRIVAAGAADCSVALIQMSTGAAEAGAGVDAGVNCAPVLPEITDCPRDLEALVKAGALLVAFTVSVKAWVALGLTPLAAWMLKV